MDAIALATVSARGATLFLDHIERLYMPSIWLIPAVKAVETETEKGLAEPASPPLLLLLLRTQA